MGFVVVYVLGYFVAFFTIGLLNRVWFDRDEIIPIKYALLWALLSWLFLLITLLGILLSVIFEPRFYKIFKVFFKSFEKDY